MTRESRARWLAAATTALVVLLAALFAVLHNLPAPPAREAHGPPTPPTAAAPALTPPPTDGGAAPDVPRPAAAEPPAPSETSPAPPQPAAVPDPARVAAGQRAYARLGCAMCHSIDGRGNPGRPLDGVGARLDRKALYELTTGSGAAAAQMGAGLARRKQRAVGDPEMDVLLDYLAQLD